MNWLNDLEEYVDKISALLEENPHDDLFLMEELTQQLKDEIKNYTEE